MHKGIHRDETRTALWLYRFHAPQHSCITVPGEKELELQKNKKKKKMRKMTDIFYMLARFRVKERISLSFV